MKKRETFIWVGDGMGALEPGELVEKMFRAEDGRIGKIVENGYLDVTVEFDESPVKIMWNKIKSSWNIMKPLEQKYGWQKKILS